MAVAVASICLEWLRAAAAGSDCYVEITKAPIREEAIAGHKISRYGYASEHLAVIATCLSDPPRNAEDGNLWVWIGGSGQSHGSCCRGCGN